MIAENRSQLFFYIQVTKDLENILRDGKLADFLIIAGGREFSCHKAILAARSPFFAAMFQEHTEEAQQNRVKFEDLDSDVSYCLVFFT